MAETHVISALVKKRAELLGDIEHYEQIIKEFRANLITIDKAIVIFDENYDVGAIEPSKKYRNRIFKHGEAKVLTLEVLKGSSEPLTTDKIVELVAELKNTIFESKAERNNFHQSVLLSLNTSYSNGLVDKVAKPGYPTIWSIKQIG